MDEEPGASQPFTIEMLKSKIFFLINEPDGLVSTVYSTYVRPYCDQGGSYSEFLIDRDELFSLPARIQKIRMFLFQVMIHLGLLSQENVEDPIPDDEYASILLLVRAISPLAVAYGSEVLMNFLHELAVTHYDVYPNTIQMLHESLGVVDKQPVWEVDRLGKRIHYQETIPFEPQKPKLLDERINRPPPHGLFLNRPSLLSRTVKIRVKKSKHVHQPKPSLGNTK